jgi:two-component system KDP operon response regulator KdpE
VVRVLVIDDEPDVLLLCRVNLRHDGHEVLEAPDGATGLALAAQEPPDVVVLDLMMPSIDGYGVLAALRGSASTEGLPVLILSAKAQMDERRRALESGGDAFLAKPFAPQELGEVIRELATIDPVERAEARQAALRELEAKLL